MTPKDSESVILGGFSIMGESLDAGVVEAIRGAFSGRLLLKDDDDYDTTRRIFNGLIDKRPGLIAQCANAADVATAIGFARSTGLEIAVRGGGHSVAGRSTTDGGVMIDLSRMKRIDVDPETRTARAQGGVTWGEFDGRTAKHGLATTGGTISTTGIAGLTLGGGFGYLAGSCGLTADNLISAELVTANGDVLSVNDADHEDLLWALRGAGANFGVATSLEYRLHPVEQVVGGVIVYPVEAAGDVLRHYREFTADASDELSALAGLGHAPDGSGTPVAVVLVAHSGDAAEADLKPLVDFGSPMMVEVGPMPYPTINTILDEAYPAGSLNYWKSSFLRELDDPAVDTMVETFASCPSPMTAFAMEHFHGAATRVGVSDTAVPHREQGYNYLLTSVWMDPARSDENIAWTREAYAAMEPHFAQRRYVNYLSDDDGGASGQTIYGENYGRLRALKARYDPDNVFRLNQNIEPAAGPAPSGDVAR